MKRNKASRAGRVILRAAGIVLLAIVVLFAGLIGYLSATEYRPDDMEKADVQGAAADTLRPGGSLEVVTWNIGYGALGDDADFFMDGGSGVRAEDEARVRENLDGILAEIETLGPDLLLLQEADLGSDRSCRVDEAAYFRAALPGYASTFAGNFKVAFLPYPIPPLGRVDSGLLTFSAFPVREAERIQLPIPFSWPMRMANLKRCLLVERIPLEGSDRELVLINLHLEAYDDGEGKAAQTAMLLQVLEAEAARGSYVIAGGDFNQIFSNADTGAFPAQEGKWQAGQIDAASFGSGWQLMMDASVPSCRSLDQPYLGADQAGFQYYLIDGFIFSSNVQVDELQTVDCGFVCTDHNPVCARVTLVP